MFFGTKQKNYKLKEFLKNNWSYLGLYLVALSVALYYLLSYDKLIIHQMVNYWVGNPVANTFYKYFTNVGDGIFAVAVGVIVLLDRKSTRLNSSHSDRSRMPSSA